MKGALFIGLVVTVSAGVPAFFLSGHTMASRSGFLNDKLNYPYTYCMENFSLTVDSMELSNPPAKGQTVSVEFAGTSNIDTTAVSVTEIITLNGVQVSNTSKKYSATYKANKPYSLTHDLTVGSDAKAGSYTCKISIQNSNNDITCASISYSL